MVLQFLRSPKEYTTCSRSEWSNWLLRFSLVPVVIFKNVGHFCVELCPLPDCTRLSLTFTEDSVRVRYITWVFLPSFSIHYMPGLLRGHQMEGCGCMLHRITNSRSHNSTETKNSEAYNPYEDLGMFKYSQLSPVLFVLEQIPMQRSIWTLFRHMEWIR